MVETPLSRDRAAVASPRRVAWLALLYDACARSRHRGPGSIFDDFETCRGEVSIATLEASTEFTPLDWLLVESLDEPQRANELVTELAQRRELLRAEALLHAIESGAEHGGARWRAVERAKEELAGQGLVSTRDEIESVAVGAYTAVVGRTHADYLDEFLDDE